ncbi:MAG: DUF190 domain-containing protein [Anaerolineales bacterium]|nr:DUF190 domain-containing protein [Anaerolineales bacterium]
MRIEGPAQRLCIYLGESDQWRGRPLYLALLEALKRAGLAGATVSRGLAGFGAHSRIHTVALEALSSDLPLVVEVIDTRAAIARAVTEVGPMVREGLITLEDLRVIKYTHRYLQPLPGDRLVKEVMTRAVTRAAPATPLAELVALLVVQRLKAVPVVDEAGRVVGLISDGDILKRGAGPARLAVLERLDEAGLAAQLAALRASGQTAADVMTQPVVTVREDTALAHAVQLMVKHNLKRLPVVDQAGRLAGMLSRVDVLRTVAGPAPQPEARPAPAAAGHTVGELMDTAVPTVPADADVVEIVTRMVGAESKRVVVVDEAGRALGAITDGDLVARVRPEARGGLLAALTGRGHAPAADQTAREMMSPVVLTGPPETPIAQAIQQMLTHQRKRFYVVDAAGRLLGAVDRQTLLRAVAGPALADPAG